MPKVDLEDPDDQLESPSPKLRLVEEIGVLTTVGFASLAMFFFSFWAVQIPPACRSFEFCQYAEIGKNIATEGVFETKLAEPMALAYLDQHQISTRGDRWPVINRYPLPSVVAAGFSAILGATDLAAALPNGLAVSLLCVLGTYLARQWYGKVWGWVFALLFLANPSLYGFFVLMGTPDVLFAFVFLLQMFQWTRLMESNRPSVGQSIFFGVLCGLSFLARFNMAVFLPIQFGALLLQRRWTSVALAAVAAVVCSAPLAAYNLHHFGRPMVSVYSEWNLLDGIGAFKVEPWLYYHSVDRSVDVVPRLGALWTKWRTNLFTIVPFRIWTLWHLYVLFPAGAVGLLLPFPNGSARRMLTTCTLFFAMQLVLFSALRLELADSRLPWHGRYFFWFAVPVMLLGLQSLRCLWERRSLKWLVLALMVGQFFFFGRTWRTWIEVNKGASRDNLGNDPIRRMLAQVVPKDKIIASDSPQVLLWCSGLKAVSLPANPAELKKINQLSAQPIDFIFLDLSLSSIDLDPEWRTFVKPRSKPSLWEQAILEDFEYVLNPDETRRDNFVLLKRKGATTGKYEPSAGPP